MMLAQSLGTGFSTLCLSQRPIVDFPFNTPVMIVFGTYAFPIQTLNPLAYGLPDGVKIQLFCKIFHLFWIPLFPIDRMWVVKMNGEKYEPSPEIRQRIDMNEQKKFPPFYAFALPLLIAIGIPSFGAYESYQDGLQQERYEARQEQMKQEMLGTIEFPEQGDIFFMNRHQEGQPTYKVAETAGLVEAVTTDSVLLRMPSTNESLGSYAINKYFSDPDKAIYYGWIAKKDLRERVKINGSRRDYTGLPIQGIYKGWQIAVTKKGKINNNVWETLSHPQPPYSRFRASSK